MNSTRTRGRTVIALLALAGLVVTSGCSLVLSDSTQFTATPASVCATEATDTGYALDAEGWDNRTREFEVTGQSREVRMNSYRRTYVRETQEGNRTGGVAVLATPRATIAGEPRNPVGSWSHRRVLEEFGGELDQYGSLENVSRTRTDTREVLGSTSTVSRFDATGRRDGDTVGVRVTVARVEHDGDFVLVGAVHERGDAEARDRTERLLACLNHGAADGGSGETDAGSTVMATATETAEAELGQATVAARSKIVSGTGGDVLHIPVSLQNTNTATMVLGGQQLNYRVTSQLTDRDGDGLVTVTWNTSVAGRMATESAAFGATGPDQVTGVSRSTGQLTTQLQNTSYPISVRVDGTETDVGTAVLRRETDGG